jgi:hypothetical protein
MADPSQFCITWTKESLIILALVVFIILIVAVVRFDVKIPILSKLLGREGMSFTGAGQAYNITQIGTEAHEKLEAEPETELDVLLNN